MDLSTGASIAALKKNALTIKEGVEYKCVVINVIITRTLLINIQCWNDFYGELRCHFGIEIRACGEARRNEVYGIH